MLASWRDKWFGGYILARPECELDDVGNWPNQLLDDAKVHVIIPL